MNDFHKAVERAYTIRYRVRIYFILRGGISNAQRIDMSHLFQARRAEVWRLRDVFTSRAVGAQRRHDEQQPRVKVPSHLTVYDHFADRDDVINPLWISRKNFHEQKDKTPVVLGELPAPGIDEGESWPCETLCATWAAKKAFCHCTPFGQIFRCPAPDSASAAVLKGPLASLAASFVESAGANRSRARGPPHGRKAVRADRKPTYTYRRGFDDQVAQQRSLFVGMDDTVSVLSQARSTKSDSSSGSSLAKLESKMAALGSGISSLGSGMQTL